MLRAAPLLLAALLVACASRSQQAAPPAEPAPPPAAPAPPPAASAPPAEPAPEAPFHVVAVSVLSGGKAVDSTRLCPIPGAVFVCGKRRLFHLAGDDLVHDPALEAGLPRGADGRLADEPYRMLGRWPDDAWLVMGRFGRSLHRWSKGRWVHVHTWPEIGNYEAVEITPWTRGRVLVYYLRLYDRETFETYGDGPAPKVPALTPSTAPGTPCRSSQRELLQIEPDGSIVLRRARCTDRGVEVVERWAPGATSSTVVEEPPPPVPQVKGTYRFEDVRFVRVREDGARVPIAMPALPDLAPPGSSSLRPSSIWEIAPDDVWVLAHFRPPSGGPHAKTGLALLRTRRPTRPLDLTR